MKWTAGLAVSLAGLLAVLFIWYSEIVRDDIQSEVGSLRSDMEASDAVIRSDMGSLRSDIETLKADSQITRAGIQTLNAKVNSQSASIDKLTDRVQSQGEDIAAIKALLESARDKGLN